MNIQHQTGNLVDVINGLNEPFTIERAILKPVVEGERVLRYSIEQSEGLFILYPYTVDDKGKASLINSTDLTKKFPKAWEYLNHHRKILGARDGGECSKRPDWYAYARSQNIGTFLNEKFLVPYMATRLKVAFDQDQPFL